MSTESTAYRTCPLCEATCGLEIDLEDERVTRIRGDRDDVFSHGFICPKGSTLKQLHEDPDRAARAAASPRGRRASREVTWDEAFAEIERRLTPIWPRTAATPSAVYLGNPIGAQPLGAPLPPRAASRRSARSNVFTASTVDQMPKQVSSACCSATALSMPVPDLDRTDFLLMLGANPLASNGCCSPRPTSPGGSQAIRERGRQGRRRRPPPHPDGRGGRRARGHPARHRRPAAGRDANVVFGEGLADAGRGRPTTCNGMDEARAAVADFTPGSVSDACGIPARHHPRAWPASWPRHRARRGLRPDRHLHAGVRHAGQLAGRRAQRDHRQPRPPGRRDVPQGGRRAEQQRRQAGPGPWRRPQPLASSRVRGAGESWASSPCVCLAEEIETPGEGQIRALVTIAGNPVLSTPNGGASRRRPSTRSTSWCASTST